jgi:hypothetical protein
MKNFLLLLIFSSFSAFAQEVDITDALKKVEIGKLAEANSLLMQLKQTNPNDAAVIFLDAVLTADGNEAQKKYSSVFEKFPNSQYADASMYRVFSYYYSIGLYKKAGEYLALLKHNYPQSAYINTAERSIPNSDEENKTPTVESPTPKQTPIKIVKTEEPKASQAANFTIQAGAFLSAENAKHLSDQLNKDGYTSEIVTKDIGGSQLKVVTAGKFVTEDDAKKVLSAIEVKYNLRGRIIPISGK